MIINETNIKGNRYHLSLCRNLLSYIRNYYTLETRKYDDLSVYKLFLTTLKRHPRLDTFYPSLPSVGLRNY